MKVAIVPSSLFAASKTHRMDAAFWVLVARDAAFWGIPLTDTARLEQIVLYHEYRKKSGLLDLIERAKDNFNEYVERASNDRTRSHTPA